MIEACLEKALLGLRPCDLVPLPGRSLTLAVPDRTASVSERPVAKEQFLAVKALEPLSAEHERIPEEAREPATAYTHTIRIGHEMNRKLTITVSESVYEGLHRTIGRRRISQFIEKLARPHVVPADIEASYRDMAADQQREQEALDWSEGAIADSSPTDPHASP